MSLSWQIMSSTDSVAKVSLPTSQVFNMGRTVTCLQWRSWHFYGGRGRNLSPNVFPIDCSSPEVLYAQKNSDTLYNVHNTRFIILLDFEISILEY